MTKFVFLSKFIFVLACALLISGCGAASGGYAPANEVPKLPNQIDPNISGDHNFKYGTTVQSSNGWKINYDSSDPVTAKTISNGWKVEVKYE